MQVFCLLFLSYLLFVNVTTKDVGREGRWFFDTETITKHQTQLVTSLLPSSCVFVSPTLPACKTLKNLQNFPKFVSGRVLKEHDENKESGKFEFGNEDDSEVGWAEYLGIVPPAITKTETILKTTTLIDPRVVVTFSVKGCKPSNLPYGLEQCPSNTIKPTTTASTTIFTTSLLRNNTTPAPASTEAPVGSSEATPQASSAATPTPALPSRK